MTKTIKLKKMKIRGVKKNEIYFPGNGSGSFKDKHGYEYSISNAAAGTMRFLKALATAEKQFDFFCYAYLRQVIYRPLI
jgi:NAD-dependent DNA ligase